MDWSSNAKTESKKDKEQWIVEKQYSISEVKSYVYL